MRALLVFASLAAFAAPSLAQPAVFSPVQTQRSALSAEQARYLEAIHGYRDRPQLLRAAPDLLDAGGEVSFPLGDALLVVSPDRIERFEKGAFSWFGTVREADGTISGQAIVSVKDGLVLGDFVVDDTHFALKPLGGGLHALVEVDREQPFEAEDVDLAALRRSPEMMAPSAQAAAPAAERSASGAPVYRVLFPYTPPALNVIPDVGLVAQQSIAYANQAYVNSQVNLRAEFAGLYELNVPESGRLQTDLERLQNLSDGFGDDVHVERNRVGADIVTLFRTADTTSTAGVAYVCASPGFAFGVFEIDGTGTGIVFTHEVGHVLGGGHEDTNAAGCHSYSRAKELSNGQRTVMYSSFSSSSTIPYFSNPAISVAGDATGEANARHNARTFNERAATVSSFRTGTGLTGTAIVQPGSPLVQVLPGTTEPVEVEIQNTGAGSLTWWGITSASPDVTFHTLGELVLSDLDATGRVLTPAQGSCSSGNALTEGFATFDFGFDFPFNGEVYTEARVSTNGFVVFDTFDGCANADSAPSSIPATGGPNSYISTVWSPDVRPVRSSGGQETRIFREVLSDGRVSIKWIDMGMFIPSIPGSFFFVSAQAIFGPDGGVEFRYDDLFRVLVGDTDFELSDGTEIDVPLTRDIRSGIEYAGNDGSEIPFGRLQTAGQVFFPNPALELTASSQTIAAAQTATIPLRVNADKMPLGDYTIPLQLITNDPERPILEIPVRVRVVTVIDNEEDPKAVLAFEAVRPNPVADAASLVFSLAVPSSVEVAVFDALGREVQRVDLGLQLGGVGEAALDTSALAPGVYIVRLEAGDEMRSRRLTVVR